MLRIRDLLTESQDWKQSKHGNTIQIYSKLDTFNAFYLLQLFIVFPMVKPAVQYNVIVVITAKVRMFYEDYLDSWLRRETMQELEWV
jgi:hypothetical protein